MKAVVFGGLDGIICAFASVASVVGASYTTSVIFVLVRRGVPNKGREEQQRKKPKELPKMRGRAATERDREIGRKIEIESCTAFFSPILSITARLFFLFPFISVFFLANFAPTQNS